MQTEQIVALLVAERDRLNRAIQALQGGSARGTATHHVPAKAAAAPAAKKAKKRAGMSAAARKAQSERMRAFWAAKRKQKSK
jgi:hypothetical protein